MGDGRPARLFFFLRVISGDGQDARPPVRTLGELTPGDDRDRSLQAGLRGNSDQARLDKAG